MTNKPFRTVTIGDVMDLTASELPPDQLAEADATARRLLGKPLEDCTLRDVNTITAYADEQDAPRRAALRRITRLRDEAARCARCWLVVPPAGDDIERANGTYIHHLYRLGCSAKRPA